MFNTAKRLGTERSESEPVEMGSVFSSVGGGAVYNSETEPSLQPMADSTGKTGVQDYNLSFQASGSLIVKWKLITAPFPYRSSYSERWR